MKTDRDLKKGVATLEILIAFAVIILSISAVILVTFGNQLSVVDAEITSRALYKSAKTLEDLKASSKFDFNLVNPKNFADTYGQINFLNNLEVRQVDFFTKQATSTISWQSRGKTFNVSQSRLITNLNSISGKDTCSSIASGDWKNPNLTSFEFGKDLLGDSVNVFPISSIDVSEGKMFVSLSNSSLNNFPTLFEFDISNPTSPTFLTGVDNDPTVKLGINAIVSADKYVFVANAKQSNFGTCSSGTCGQLQIIDTSVSPPFVVKTFKIPTITGTAGQAVGKSIYYKKDFTTGKEYIYLGLAKTLTGPEFNIIDVTDKNNPIYLSGFSVGNAINSIYIRNNFAYIATPNTENLTVIDVSNPLFLNRVNGYSPTGGSNGESVYAVGTTVYLGRTFGTNEFHILDISNPPNMNLINSKDIGSGTSTSINDILVRDYLAFMITNSQFQIWNVLDTNNIFPWTQNNVTSEFLNLPGGKGVAMDCEGNYFFVGSLPSNNKSFVSIITSN